MKFLREHPSVVGVEDLRSLRVMREADVDVSFSLVDGRVKLAEIKSDWHMGVSGNVLFEVLRINHTAPPDKCVTLGWTVRSPANWLMYYAPQKNKIYQCRFDDLRFCFQEYSRQQREKSQVLQFDWTNTDNIKSTLNILIPWAYCKGAFVIHDLAENA